MRLSLFGALAPLFLSVVAEKLVLNTVEHLVQQILEDNSDYVNYNGPSQNETISGNQNTSDTTTTNKIQTNVNAASTTYWYEAITKQGLAPEAATDYVIYRNVKDYGAVGMCLTSEVKQDLGPGMMLTLHFYRRRRYGRHCSNQCSYQRWRTLWPGLRFHDRNTSRSILSCRHLFDLFLHH